MTNPSAILSILLPTAAICADLGCRGNPKLTGACYATSGEVILSADIGYVFQQEGSNIHFVVRAAPQSKHDAPTSVWNELIGKTPLATVTGNFVVCPIPDQPSQFTRGEVSYVCIESASHIVAHSDYVPLRK